MPRIREFDYVIIGAGSAGNVLATRLTEDVNGYQQEGFGPMDRFVTPQRRLD